MSTSDDTTDLLPVAPSVGSPLVRQPRVNLLPGRVRDVRAVRGRRRGALLLVLLAVVLVGAGYAVLVAAQQTADAELRERLDTRDALLVEQRAHADVAGILDDARLVDARLGELLVDDVAAADLVAAVRDALPDGSTLTGISLSVPGADGAGTSAPGGASAELDASGETAIGIVEISGTGRTQTEIRAFSEALGEVTGLRVPYLVSARALDDARGNAFTMRATLTEAARTERFQEDVR
ncbi:hypothetical protein [Microbacterium karelineae]|uniref:hypothetical protein n=1 Tax=Microbacterium karelineae TaxID=2654283 RepID=UPI0012E9D563|nr:hypothetical protein [Microbacterium karelineae]